ncbi:hypothetical protein Q5P01_019991 [Channa striata]|uniref:DRBM domain-containing protein n=1 Tax=Channa striata TaxID=64152 RepID=A0AA88LWM8_CHASR|nr:hypothetical protein Q5P01_019991 [Channa striata]
MSFADFFGLRHPAPDREHKRLAGPARSSRSPEASRDLIASNSSPLVLKLLHCGRARVYRGMEGNWLSRLKEYGDKTGRAVKYTQLSSTGPSDSPTFSYRVLGRDKDEAGLRVEGSGSKKSLAKAQAARVMLAHLSTTKQTRDRAPSADIGNYVGELQELCQKRKWPLPCYVEQEFVTGQFLCRCTAVAVSAKHSVDMCIRAVGTGNSKKVAKAAAAKNALSFANKLLDD